MVLSQNGKQYKNADTVQGPACQITAIKAPRPKLIMYH